MMQIVMTIITVFLFLLIAGMLGTIYNNCIGMQKGNALISGFFLYFALFEIVALPMIILQKSLSTLCVVWGIVCIVIVGAFLALKGWHKKAGATAVLDSNQEISVSAGNSENRAIRIDNGECERQSENARDDKQRLYGIIAGMLFILQCILAFLKPNNSWDTAFYIGNVVEAIQTNTMYLYDGYTGWKDAVLNIKYAMCSFYMNDAVIGSVFGIHGAVVCRVFNTLICHIFAAYIIYRLGMEIWERKKAALVFVIFWLIANMGISTTYFASSFLMNRSYEAKAFCANIVLPGVLLLLLKIWKVPADKCNWISLFVVNIASVAISSSSLMLVPLLEGIMLLGMICIKKKPVYILHSIVCVLPSVGYIALYLLHHLGMLNIPIV